MSSPNKRLWPAVLLLAVGMGLGLAPGAVQTVAAQTIHDSITVQPLGLAYGFSNLEYEHMLGSDTAGAVRVDFFSRGLGSFVASAIGLGASYRWFTAVANEAPPRGLWFGPSADWLQVNAQFAGDSSTSGFLQLAADLGYKWIIPQAANLVLSPFAQFGYEFGSLNVAGSNLDYGNRFIINVGLSIGLAF